MPVELQPSAGKKQRATAQLEAVQIRQALPAETRQRLVERRLASQSQRLKPSLEGKRQTALEHWQAERGQKLRQELEPWQDAKNQTALVPPQVEQS